MAKRTLISITDDLDGTEGAETVHFSCGGHSYEIDLSQENRKTLEELLRRYIIGARRVSGQPAARRSPGKTNAGVNANAIRVWAWEQGMQVSERGRISKKVLDAYAEAHPA